MKRIFQYRSLTYRNENGELVHPYTLWNLEKNQIYLNKCRDVNDPYEGIHNYKVKENLKMDFVKFYYKHNYKEDMLKKHTLDEWINEIKLCSVNEFLDTIGISCFSSNLNSFTMWGHYADSSKGICIEFDKDKDIFKHLEKVDYYKEPYTMEIKSKEDISLDFIDSKGPKIFKSKHISWEYEEEFRLYGFAGDTYEYIPESIVAIYFGSKVGERTIYDVYKSTKHLSHLKYYYMQLNFNSYEMNPIDMTEEIKQKYIKGFWSDLFNND